MGNGVGAEGRLKQPPRKGSRSLLDVVHAEGDHAADVVVVQRVVDGFAVPPELDQLAGFEHPQLVADRALRDAHDLGNIVDAELTLE